MPLVFLNLRLLKKVNSQWKRCQTTCLITQKMHKEHIAFLISSLPKTTNGVLDFVLKHTNASSNANRLPNKPAKSRPFRKQPLGNTHSQIPSATLQSTCGHEPQENVLTFISQGCCNQLPQTVWLETTEFIYSVITEARSLKSKD